MLLAIKWKYITPLKHLIYKIKICNHDFLNRRIHYLSAASTVMSPLRKGKPEVAAHTGGCLTVRDPYRGHMPHPQGIKPCSLGLFCWCIGFGCRIRIYSTSHLKLHTNTHVYLKAMLHYYMYIFGYVCGEITETQLS